MPYALKPTDYNENSKNAIQHLSAGTIVSFIKLVIFILCFHAFSVFANSIDCEPSTTTGGHNYDQWSQAHADFEVKPTESNITVGTNIPDWSTLYSISRVLVSVSAGTCTSGETLWMSFTMFSSYTESIGTVNGSIIYPTNTPGIGISIDDSNNSHHYKPFPDYEGNIGAFSSGTQMWVDIKYWKIPGQIPMNAGTITVDGPDMGIILSNTAGNYSITSNSPGRIYKISTSSGNGDAYLTGSRVLNATLIFQPGTCNIEGDNVKVNMGNYDGAGGYSDWKDASFKLVCPDGYGYGGIYDTNKNDAYNTPYNISQNGKYTANTSKNGRVQISIVPYTEVIDANKGIIALDGTGAQGYGIQLAWGDYSSQSLIEPSNPVILNSYVDANSLNSGFGAGDTPIGSNAFSGTDNTIKMAARYIRTTGETAPGPANAIVQVIANYQ